MIQSYWWHCATLPRWSLVDVGGRKEQHTYRTQKVIASAACLASLMSALNFWHFLASQAYSTSQVNWHALLSKLAASHKKLNRRQFFFSPTVCLTQTTALQHWIQTHLKPTDPLHTHDKQEQNHSCPLLNLPDLRRCSDCWRVRGDRKRKETGWMKGESWKMTLEERTGL